MYYGCGNAKRPWAHNGGSRRSKKHAELMSDGQLTVTILATYTTREDAELHERALITEGRRIGLKLFNVLLDFKEFLQAGGRVAGKINSASCKRRKVGIFSEEHIKKRAEYGSLGGLLPWWNDPVAKVRRRSVECPGATFVRGKGTFTKEST